MIHFYEFTETASTTTRGSPKHTRANLPFCIRDDESSSRPITPTSIGSSPTAESSKPHRSTQPTTEWPPPTKRVPTTANGSGHLPPLQIASPGFPRQVPSAELPLPTEQCTEAYPHPTNPPPVEVLTQVFPEPLEYAHPRLRSIEVLQSSASESP